MFLSWRNAYHLNAASWELSSQAYVLVMLKTLVAICPYNPTHFDPEDGGSVFLWDVCIHLQDYTMLCLEGHAMNSESYL
jgi:hypothetical protein